MSNLREFSLFPLLPKELRLEIWESTLSPRLLSLNYTILKHYHRLPYDIACNFTRTPRKDQSLWLATHFRLTLVSTDPIAILSTCHESRTCGINSGYRIWKLHNQEGYTREVFWNPNFDTVAFVRPHRYWWTPEYLTRIFEIQFPSQTMDVQKMALPTTIWGYNPTLTHQAEILLPYKSLSEIVIMMDGRWFYQGSAEYGYHTHLYKAGDSLLVKLYKLSRFELEKHASPGWRIPDVRVVGEDWQGEILGVDKYTNGVTLFPCPELDTTA